MKILLIQPRSSIGNGLAEIANVEPYGLEMIAGSLVSEHEVEIYDFIDNNSFLEVLTDYKPDFCGISCSFTVDVYRTRDVARIIKEWNDRTTVFVGGHHASLNAEDFFDLNIDFVVIGEGEITTREAVHSIFAGKKLEDVPGLAVNADHGQVLTGSRKLIANLDDLPHPARKLTREYRKDYFLGFRKPLAVVETTRGCPYRCNFCSVRKFYRGKCRSMSVKRAFFEISSIEEEHVLITDDNFLIDIKRAAKIAEKIIDSAINKSFTIQARSDTIIDNPGLIPLLKKAGISQVFIGFEKIDDRDLDGVNKKNTADNNERALDLLRNNGIDVIASFIIDPQFERYDFIKMIKYIRKLDIRYPAFSILTPFPGTALYEKYKDKLASDNFELFDLMHSVLPTKLTEREFYREYSRLYRAAYLRADYLLQSLKNLIVLWATGRLSSYYLKTLLTAGRHFAALEKKGYYS